jgi:lysylphosphatidylglycerol synthetase-like protein (DUF2156 family)
MQIFLLLIIALLVFFLGLASISQAYATTQQAQAAIEASRATQIASAGNLITLVTVTLVIIVMLAAVVMIAWLLLRAKFHPKNHWISGSNANWERIPQPQTTNLLPTLLTMLLYQMMQSQQQRESDQSWMMNEPANEITSFSDNIWDM